MKSKEVEEAIEQFKKYIKEPITTTTDERMGYTKVKTKFHIPSEKNIETVLNYISELENSKSQYFIPKAIIRIKIKEYENKILELYKKDLWKEPEYTILKLKYENYIEVLKEIIGE